MFNRVNWKFVFKCFAWLVCLGGIVTLMSFVEVKKHTVLCTNIKILIPGADNFIEREEIDAILKQSEGQLIGRSLEGINLNAIEEKIKANPYIALSTVYADMDGVIHIEISQRQPILRIINAGGQDYYIDRNGLKMPVSPNFTANVLVANGHILEHFSGKVDTLITKMAADLYKTALFLKKDTLWDAQIEQIFVNDKDDIELVPRVGDQRIILGTADSLDTKMTNLLAFYKKAMPQVGWDTYKTINIKYSNQIVCEKNNPDSLRRAMGAATAFKPTMAAAKKVMDSLVKAEIASELHNNPDENEIMTTVPDENFAPVVAAAVHKPEVKKVEKPAAKAPELKKAVAKPVAKSSWKPEAKKTEVKKAVVKPEVKSTWKPEAKKTDKPAAAKTEEKKTVKPAGIKKAAAKPEVKSSAKPAADKAAVKKTVKPAEEKKTVKPAELKKPAKAHTSAMPEIRWIKPVTKAAKPADKKDTKKNK
ncbi:Cell division septal protein FtsQ [Pedobacter westerhofensis]|uniref:Cell division septal protein FtsQ n=1 Tax=Pedobacter westerhofensis TaxID=425512 RepID=A0A521FNV0_9SPHI|nr:cell division protein FtsQ [Pedobacter westerhofensis]SMO97877.1 Cell division septal protein FtsQ [Pedobacter westerhofensis]